MVPIGSIHAQKVMLHGNVLYKQGQRRSRMVAGCVFFSFEPTLPAYQPYYVHAVGHFQRLQRPIRLAVVSSATESAMAALEARGYCFCMIGRTEQLVERWM